MLQHLLKSQPENTIYLMLGAKLYLNHTDEVRDSSRPFFLQSTVRACFLMFLP